ncbi:MAG: DUF349 domain-containing protein [Gammaproteobacteria bacterium]|nr:DUF349 domain-containing protein [Gammaproteobacteria bacterium]
MTLFDSLSKPGWQSKKPEVRLAAIDEIDDESILLQLVREDPEAEIQAQALARVASSKLLDELCESLSPPLQNQARAQRLKQLLPDESKLSSISDDSVLVRIASLSNDPELISASISKVRSTQTRMELAGSHPLARVRLNAAQGIEDIDLLKELMHLSKHKDKSVFRHCKEIVDQHNAAERKKSERQQRIQQLAEDVRQLSTSVDSPEFKARFTTLEHRWSALQEHADSEFEKQINDDLEICSKRIEKLDRAHEAEQARQDEIEASEQTFRELLSELESIEFAGLDLSQPKSVRQFAKNLDGIEDRWLAAMHHARPTADQTQTCKHQLNHWRTIAQASKRVLDKSAAFEKLHEDLPRLDKSDYIAVSKLLARVDKQIVKTPWPETVSEATPAPILKLVDLQHQLQQTLSELKKAEKKTLEKLETAFTDLRRELEDNHFRNADKAHNRVRNLLRHLSVKQQDHFHHELRPLTARLREVHDWQGFAIEPKKIELCERMAALIDSPEPPDVLAKRIKSLQEEWKALGPLSPRKDQELWKKFHAAAEQAYAPCKEAFKQQAVVRKENLKRRMELVSQLIDYDQRMAWPDRAGTDPDTAAPDWKMVQKTLDTARAAFNEIQPVSGKGEHKSRKALQAVCNKIYDHIKDEYERNIALKKGLVRQAQELVELENLRDAIDRAKGIQREWKNVGMTPRQVDRKLWKAFRGACDAVFARLDEERKQQDVARNERTAAAKARAEQVRERALKEQQRWPDLLDRLRACATRAEDEEKATALWQKEGDVPKGVEKEAVLAYWENGPDENLPEEDARKACIAMEVLVGADSPPQDKEARMAYQMERLLEGIGSQHGDTEQLLIEQINAFVAMRPEAPWLERFFCEGKIIPRKT